LSGGSELGNVRMAPAPPVAPGEDGDEPSLVKSILQRRKRFVLVTTAVCVLATLAATATQTKMYSSTSSVQVFAPPGQVGANGPNMATEVQIARSSTVAKAAAARLGIHIAPAELLSRVGVVVPADSDVLDVTYSSPSPKDAQKGAQEFANAFAVVRAQQFQKQNSIASEATVNQINDMRGQLSRIQQKLTTATGRTKTSLSVQSEALLTRIALKQQSLADLNENALDFTPATPLGDAPLPKSPSKPNVPLNLILGLFGGLLIGFGIAALAEFLDDRVRSPRDLQGRLGTPVLGLIPKDSSEAPHAAATFVALGAPTSPSGDALRRLSTNVAAAAAETGTRSIAITSVDRHDAPAELITNLASLLAASGKRVVLVSMARRWPTLEETFGAPPGPGFLDALAGTVPVRSALAPTEVENLLLCRRGRADLIEIGTGHASSDRPRAVAVPSHAPSYALGSERTAELTADLGEPFDFVIVDAPALLGDADATALSRACDAVLAVATPATTRTNIAQAREQLEHVRATLLGSVLMEVGDRRDDGAGGLPRSFRIARDSVMQRVKLPRVSHGRSSGR
jgi:capsular polysaccharide biosynthesis protein/Mrp family chromosome partitioning ATPase